MTAVLSIRNLGARIKGGGPRLLRGVSLELEEGAARCLVGESGAGKSMIGKAVLGILPPAAEITSGEIQLAGENLLTMTPEARRRLVIRTAALIPQDPLTALNPVKRIGAQITAPLIDLQGWTRARAQARALEALEEVHIPEPARVMRMYPHELSGGMRQRALIAAAFASEPKLIIADEPTTALDATVQKQVLRLIADMRARHGTALLFVTHDLGVVSKVCDRLTVLYAGKVVEEAAMRDFFKAPRHAYSRALLAATPRHDDPTGGLAPASPEVIAAVQAEIRAWDAEANRG